MKKESKIYCLNKEWIFFTCVLLISVIVFVTYSISTFYDLTYSIFLSSFLFLLCLITLYFPIKKDYYAKLSSKDLINEVHSKNIFNQNQNNIKYLTLTIFTSLLIGLISALSITQFFSYKIPIVVSILLGLVIVSISSYLLVLPRIWMLNKFKKNK